MRKPPKQTNRLSFELTDKETKRYYKFSAKHRKCREKAGRKTFSGFPVGNVEIIFRPSGMGDAVEVRCPICGKTKDITDLDNW